MSDILASVPKHLLDELVEGAWLPIIGAGFSRNAIVNTGEPPASWAELGRSLALDVQGLDSTVGTLEAISAYEHAYGRVALIDRTAKLVRSFDASPGGAHLAFARVGFSDVITTNFDLLLEKAYDSIDKGCLPVIDETQLSTPNRYAGPRLVKIHGDVNHPMRMVITEDDYDQFLNAFPLLATSVAAMLVERTGILVGYSLDDPDTRQLLSFIKSRLGRMYRPLWTIQVGAASHVVSRYERRGVKVINLPIQKGLSTGQQLEEFFSSLGQFWQDRLPAKSISTDDRVAAELLLPPGASRICYFAIPSRLIGWYRENIFPEVEACGLVPVTARDVLSPPGAISAKLDTLISRALLVVAEIDPGATQYEVALAILKKPLANILIVGDPSDLNPTAQNSQILHVPRPDEGAMDPKDLVDAVRDWLQTSTPGTHFSEDEPRRLLNLAEGRAALVSAVTLLEKTLSDALGADISEPRRPRSMRSLLGEAEELEYFRTPADRDLIVEAVSARNRAIHTNQEIPFSVAEGYVLAILGFLDRLQEKSPGAVEAP